MRERVSECVGTGPAGLISEEVLNIYSVIVCYHPDVRNLVGICESLRACKSGVIIVDNTESSSLDEDALPQGCKLISLGANTGIAHAQNVGIASASEYGADVIVFFDQDSKIDPYFLPTLTSSMRAGEAQVVSPLHFDDISGVELPSVRINRFGLPTMMYHRNTGMPYPVDVVISSGTAATREAFELAGLLDESFFIDFVDTEWSLRCRSRSVPIMVVPKAVMRHRIGSASIRVGMATVLVHNPTRCYYQVRNCFLLFRKAHVPFLFALREALSVFLNRALLLFCVKNRLVYLKAYTSAIRDGIKGVVGRKPA